MIYVHYYDANGYMNHSRIFSDLPSVGEIISPSILKSGNETEWKVLEVSKIEDYLYKVKVEGLSL